jgi:uncharacterized membrane protein
MSLLWLLWLGGLLAIVAAVAYAIRGWRADSTVDSTVNSTVDSAEDVLRRRLARGEIDEQTYLRTSELLARHAGR